MEKKIKVSPSLYAQRAWEAALAILPFAAELTQNSQGREQAAAAKAEAYARELTGRFFEIVEPAEVKNTKTKK